MSEKLLQLFREIIDRGIEIEKHKQDAGVDYQKYCNEVYHILWESYRDFCKEYSQTQDGKTECATDFLGWLDKQIKIGM